MDNKKAIKIMLCEMVVKSEDAKTQAEIEILTSNIAERIVKLFAIPVVMKSVCEHTETYQKVRFGKTLTKCVKCRRILSQTVL